MAKGNGVRLYCAFCRQWGHTGPTCDRMAGLGAMMTAAVRPPLNPMGRAQKKKRGKRGGNSVKAKEARKFAVRADKADSVGERVVVKLPIRQKDGMASASGGADLSPPTLHLSSGAVEAGPKPTKPLY